ncbi:hypothetical protein FNF29_08072 [Cafeteria roenbergensis]|uniref:purine-nucleoside phosphorylase n=1 Tax=Cafeteria roenbergensis TaxID=33653 RepID=A0A5A8C076_CAFRO|nr:hypothetical protein FNF29_08072 [Cafeteria roenbergensis]|eukprot:KAA0146386.1 hypothetical protein FNF29_08072 [Cafeteria roenbergensis]
MATSPAPLETRVAQCLAYIRSQVSEKPEVAIICGSGLGGLADVIESPVSLDYKDIPHFHASSVPGHAGKLVFGTLGGKQVVAMKGRFHFYEGYPASTVAFPVRVFAALGAKALMVTNAAGGISAHLNVGDVMIIRDHIYVPGLAGNHSLVGKNEPAFGSRFVPSQGTMRADFAEHAFKCATDAGLTVHQGIYACVSGPTFESPAEARALRAMGADVVGMSTAPEVVVAAHSGLPVLAMSLVTNKVALAPAFGASKASALPTDAEGLPSHDEVLEAVEGSEVRLKSFAVEFVRTVDLSAVKAPAASTVDWASIDAEAPGAPAVSAPACCSGLGCLSPEGMLVAAAAVGAIAGAVAAFATVRCCPAATK